MAPPDGDIKFVFHRSKSKFPSLSHVKKFLHIFIQNKVEKCLRGPKNEQIIILPYRPDRPIRCKYVSAIRGKSKLMTTFTA